MVGISLDKNGTSLLTILLHAVKALHPWYVENWCVEIDVLKTAENLLKTAWCCVEDCWKPIEDYVTDIYPTYIERGLHSALVELAAYVEGAACFEGASPLGLRGGKVLLV